MGGLGGSEPPVRGGVQMDPTSVPSSSPFYPNPESKMRLGGWYLGAWVDGCPGAGGQEGWRAEGPRELEGQRAGGWRAGDLGHQSTFPSLTGMSSRAARPRSRRGRHAPPVSIRLPPHPRPSHPWLSMGWGFHF